MTHHREPLERHMLAGITEAMREKLAERRHPLREGDTEAARWAERNRVLEARLAAVREAAR